MSLITLEEARARGVALPADDTAAQDVIDEQEAWLARRIGLLVGERTETFYVALSATSGKLGLARFTDSVDVTDGGVAVDPDLLRLIDRGSAIVYAYAAARRWWTGPYVAATYTPNDETEVRGALFSLFALAVQPVNGYQSEQIGSYSYQRGTGSTSAAAARGVIVASLLPKHDPALTLESRFRVLPSDPVINRPEAEVNW